MSGGELWHPVDDGLRPILEALERLLRDLEAQARGRFGGRSIGGVAVPEIADLACTAASAERMADLRKRFVTMGVFELLREERDLIRTRVGEILAELDTLKL